MSEYSHEVILKKHESTHQRICESKNQFVSVEEYSLGLLCKFLSKTNAYFGIYCTSETDAVTETILEKIHKNYVGSNILAAICTSKNNQCVKTQAITKHLKVDRLSEFNNFFHSRVTIHPSREGRNSKGHSSRQGLKDLDEKHQKYKIERTIEDYTDKYARSTKEGPKGRNRQEMNEKRKSNYDRNLFEQFKRK